MKIVKIETIHSCGGYANSEDWAEKRKAIHEAVKKCDWPAGSGKFTVNPTRKGNGVVPIKKEFIAELKRREWTIEGKAVTKDGRDLGEFDAVVIGGQGTVVTEWETGNISSSHRSMNKLSMLVKDKIISAGVLIIPARKLGKYLTDRIGNFEELEPYIPLWKAVPCESGVLEIVVIEHDDESPNAMLIPKGTDGRAKG